MTLILDGTTNPLHKAGAFLVEDGSAAGWTQIADTLQCIHCQQHFPVRKGSGIQRGYCPSCNGVTCGGYLCETRCLHWEKALENEEKAARLLASGAVLLG